MSDEDPIYMNIEGVGEFRLPAGRMTGPATAVPKAVRAVLKIEDANGGVTTAILTGDNLRTEVDPPKFIEDRPSFTVGPPARVTSRKVGGTLAIAGLETVAIAYTEPEKPEQRFKVGDIVKLPGKGFVPVGIPFRQKGPVVQVDAIAWGDAKRSWYYHFKDRNGNYGFQVADTPELDAAEKLDRWPLRRGDFVKVDPKYFMGDDIYKLVKRVGPGDDTHYDQTKGEAWWLENEAGLTATWLRDVDAVLVDNVKVIKTQTWERG